MSSQILSTIWEMFYQIVLLIIIAISSVKYISIICHCHTITNNMFSYMKNYDLHIMYHIRIVINVQNA